MSFLKNRQDGNAIFDKLGKWERNAYTNFENSAIFCNPAQDIKRRR